MPKTTISQLLSRWTNPIRYALARADELKFHYASNSLTPDVVEVYIGEKRITRYYWIDGLSAPDWTKLGRLHRLYEAHRTRG